MRWNQFYPIFIFQKKIIYFITFYYVWDHWELHRQDIEETWAWPFLHFWHSFVNFHVKFTSWRDVMAKIWCNLSGMNAPSFQENNIWAFRLSKIYKIMVGLSIHSLLGWHQILQEFLEDKNVPGQNGHFFIFWVIPSHAIKLFQKPNRWVYLGSRFQSHWPGNNLWRPSYILLSSKCHNLLLYKERQLILPRTSRSSRSQMFFKAGFLKNFAIFTGKLLYLSLFLMKLLAFRS